MYPPFPPVRISDFFNQGLMSIVGRTCACFIDLESIITVTWQEVLLVRASALYLGLNKERMKTMIVACQTQQGIRRVEVPVVVKVVVGADRLRNVR